MGSHRVHNILDFYFVVHDLMFVLSFSSRLAEEAEFNVAW